MGLFGKPKLREPVFYKTSGSAQRQLEQLEKINRDGLSDAAKSKLDKEIKMVSLGIYGENAIEFELKNSHMAMYVLHDLYISDGDLSAQIDYMVITRGKIFVLECKNLYGNIQITPEGDFIRTVGQWKEGIYSPITQNQRHLSLIKQIRAKSIKGGFARTGFEMDFEDNYKSVIVLSNPKTILYAKWADKEITNKVVRADKLISYIKNVNGDDLYYTDKNMEERASFFLSQHIEQDRDYAKDFLSKSVKEDVSPQAGGTNTNEPVSESTILCPQCGAAMILRTARKGNNIGQKFWGCSSFPKCKSIVAIAEK